MKLLISAALAAVALSGCIAVPAPYAGDGYYYPAPAVGVGVYAAPAYPYYRHHRSYPRYRW